MRDTAEQQARDRRVTARADDDDVGVELACDVGDHVRRARRGAADELERRVEALRAGLVDLAADLGHELLLVGEDGIPARTAGEDLLAVDDDERGIVPCCERLRVRQRAVGGFRSVGRPDDRVEHVSLLCSHESRRARP